MKTAKQVKMAVTGVIAVSTMSLIMVSAQCSLTTNRLPSYKPTVAMAQLSEDQLSALLMPSAAKSGKKAGGGPPMPEGAPIWHIQTDIQHWFTPALVKLWQLLTFQDWPGERMQASYPEIQKEILLKEL